LADVSATVAANLYGSPLASVRLCALYDGPGTRRAASRCGADRPGGVRRHEAEDDDVVRDLLKISLVDRVRAQGFD
jgi:hypothetical protein